MRLADSLIFLSLSACLSYYHCFYTVCCSVCCSVQLVACGPNTEFLVIVTRPALVIVTRPASSAGCCSHAPSIARAHFFCLRAVAESTTESPIAAASAIIAAAEPAMMEAAAVLPTTRSPPAPASAPSFYAFSFFADTVRRIVLACCMAC